jgi:hypothetical protein
MSDKVKNDKRQSRGRAPGITWVLLVVGVLAVIGVVFAVLRTRTGQAFVLKQGDKEVLVLIRNDAEASYQLQYQGRGSVELRSIQPMLAGQILHVDVKQMVVSRGEPEIVVEPDGKLPEGSAITLQPGDVFDVKVTLLGQSIGGNYMYGFRIGYESGSSEQTFEVNMDFNYEIVVK